MTLTNQMASSREPSMELKKLEQEDQKLEHMEALVTFSNEVTGVGASLNLLQKNCIKLEER